MQKDTFSKQLKKRVFFNISIFVFSISILSILIYTFFTITLSHMIFLNLLIVLFVLYFLHKQLNIFEKKINNLTYFNSALKCTYGIAELSKKNGITLDEFCEGVIELLHKALRYPQSTSISISIDDKNFKSDDYAETKYVQKVEIILRDEIVGFIELFYLYDIQVKEEISLIKNISHKFSSFIYRVQSDIAFHDNEMRMNKIFDVNPNIMITTNGSKMFRANIAMLDFIGFKNIESFKEKYGCICDLFLKGKSYIEKIVNDMSWLEYILQEPQRLNRVCMMKNGKKHVFIVFAKVIKNTEEILVSFTDVTELEEANADLNELRALEKELRASKQLFDSFMQNLPAFITIKHANGRIIYSNDIAAKYFKRESLVGMSANELLPSKYASILEGMNEKAKKDGYIENIIEFEGKGSKTRFYRIVIFAIPHDKNTSVLLGTMYFDITKEYKDQHEVVKFKQVLQNSPVSIVIANTNGDIEYANPRFCQITGYSLDEIIGKNPRVLKSDYSSIENYETLWNTISSGEVWTGIFKNKKKNGDEYWESAIIAPTKNRLGEIVNYISIKQEITEEMSLRAELADKEEIMIAQSCHAAMGEMIGMIAHQWRQPISIIGMVANNMLLDVELEDLNEENCKQQAHNVLEQTEYLSKTIDDFRNFFRPNKDKDIVCVEDVLLEAKKIIGTSLEYASVILSIENGNNKQIKTYSRELLQVFINLIKNAKEALLEKETENRKIDISISEDENYIVISVCDNGGGISEENIEKIFEPYFSTKDEKNGTGLGLYMSKTIIEKHLHGSLSVTNSKDGACFKVSIPIKWDDEW